MPTFKFEAVDNNGLLVKNRIEAVSTEEAIDKIHGDGFYPTRIKQLKERRHKPSTTGDKKKTQRLIIYNNHR